MNESLESMLKLHRIHVTRPRLLVLGIFLEQRRMLDFTQVRSACSHYLNRATIYRTLHLFYEKNILSKIPSTDGVVRYVLQPAEEPARYNQLQLVCNDCGKIVTGKVDIPPYVVPHFFRCEEMELIVKGQCADCTGNTTDEPAGN